MDSLIADLILPRGPTAVIVQRMLDVLEEERPKIVCIDEIDNLTINQPVESRDSIKSYDNPDTQETS